MGLDLLLIAVGGAMLYFGAEWLVRGAAALAVRLGVRPLLVGLTVVSYATSSPELAVSISAALKGQGALVLGNVVGSNIANIGLILGLTALIAPPASDGSMARKELLILSLATLVVPVLMIDGEIHRWDSLALVLGAIAFTWLTIRWSRRRKADEIEAELPIDNQQSTWILLGISVAGLVFLIAGGEGFVRGAVGLAQAMGVDERVIGLTIVAIGTSLPELAASLVAAARGHSDIAIGNVVGSNIFNLLLILGGAGLIAPFASDIHSFRFDLAFMAALTLGAVVSLWRARRMTRFEGGLLLASYFGYLGVLVVGQQ